MADLTPSEIRQQQLTQLNNLLEVSTVQALRQAARLWHWPLRGVAKTEVVGQMLAYLSDGTRMAEAFQSLPEDERAVLQWLKVLQPPKPANRPIQAALEVAGDCKVTQKEIDALLEDLSARCLAFPNAQGSYTVPELYREWLPGLTASNLRYATEPPAVPSFTLADLSNHLQHILLNIQADRPVMTFHRPAQPDFPSGPQRSAVARPCPVAAPTLNAWGYITREERQLAGFLVETLLAGGVCQLETGGMTQFLKVRTPEGDQLLAMTPDQQLRWLRNVWLTRPSGYASSTLTTWTELDLALQHVPSHFRLYPTPYWGTQEQLVPQLVGLRKWLTALVAGLQAGVWYSVESLCTLVYRLRRNPLAFESLIFNWMWYRDGQPVDPKQMSAADWKATYGKLIEAWLCSTATWLLIVELGYDRNRPVAFRRYATAPLQDRTPLPQGAVKVTPENMIVVQNIPQTGRVRQVLRSIAAQTHHDREATTYQLDPIRFRQALLTGVNLDQLKQAFAEAGYTLDKVLAARLEAWQARVGRQQLYEQVAVIEFNEEMHPSEVAALAAAINAGPLCAVSSHCLVLLNPEQAQFVITQLRQRGYTPRVIA